MIVRSNRDENQTMFVYASVSRNTRTRSQPARPNARPFEAGAHGRRTDEKRKVRPTFLRTVFSSSEDFRAVSFNDYNKPPSRGCEKCTAILGALRNHGISFEAAQRNLMPRPSSHSPFLDLMEPGILFELCMDSFVSEDMFSNPPPPPPPSSPMAMERRDEPPQRLSNGIPISTFHRMMQDTLSSLKRLA
jgi:hypothetical protein